MDVGRVHFEVRDIDHGRFRRRTGADIPVTGDYTFWLNTDDRDLPKFLRYFSLKNREEIENIEARVSNL